MFDLQEVLDELAAQQAPQDSQQTQQQQPQQTQAPTELPPVVTAKQPPRAVDAHSMAQSAPKEIIAAPEAKAAIQSTALPSVAQPQQETPKPTKPVAVIATPDTSPTPDLPPVLTPEQQARVADQAEADRLRTTGSGLDQFSKKHPILGGLARIGDVAGSLLAPTAMALIPGTSLHHMILANQAGRRLNTDINQANVEAETAERNAQAQALLNPTRDEGKTITTAEGVMQFNPKTQRYDIKAGDPQGKYTYQETDHGLLRIESATGEATPVTSNGEPVGPKMQTENVQLISPKDGKTHTYLTNKDTGEPIKDLGETGYTNKPPIINVNAGNAALDREIKQFGNPHSKIASTGTDQLGKINDAMMMIHDGTAESIALAVPKVLTALVSGQGTGVRITQAELNAIGQARGIKGDVEGWLNGIEGKGTLSRDQKNQLTGILADVRSHISQKVQIANEATDAMEAAGTRDEILAADKAARKKYSSLEGGGDASSLPDEVKQTLKDGKPHTFQTPDGQQTWQLVNGQEVRVR